MKSMYTYRPFEKSFCILLKKKLDDHKNSVEELSTGIEIETILNLVEITIWYTNYFKFEIIFPIKLGDLQRKDH